MNLRFEYTLAWHWTFYSLYLYRRAKRFSTAPDTRNRDITQLWCSILALQYRNSNLWRHLEKAQKGARALSRRHGHGHGCLKSLYLTFVCFGVRTTSFYDYGYGLRSLYHSLHTGCTLVRRSGLPQKSGERIKFPKLKKQFSFNAHTSQSQTLSPGTCATPSGQLCATRSDSICVSVSVCVWLLSNVCQTLGAFALSVHIWMSKAIKGIWAKIMNEEQGYAHNMSYVMIMAHVIVDE